MPLIVFEGIDGCGKTTQVNRVLEKLRAQHKNVLHVREPGGTALGERQRAILLDPQTQACPTAELFGYLQARAQLCHEILAPALANGTIIILDRFYHSTLAYQAYGLGLDLAAVRGAIALAIGTVKPDLVLWLAVDPAEATRRRAAARGQDRIEARGLAYQTKVHHGYEALVKSDGLIRIDASQNADRVEAAIWPQMEKLLR
jgi:dTMP kinase